MAKIMLVEDDNNLREIYEARLLAEGYEIVSAHDGEEALALAVKEKPDLIISDVMMPKISGFDMLDILRGTPETRNTKVIMMTALSQTEDKDRADKLGADRYLVKSQVTLEDVARVAKEVLEGKEIAKDTPTPVAGAELPPVPATPTPAPAPEPTPVAVAPAPMAEPAVAPVSEPVAAPVPTPVVAEPTAESTNPSSMPTVQMPETAPTTEAEPTPSATAISSPEQEISNAQTTETEQDEVANQIEEFIKNNAIEVTPEEAAPEKHDLVLPGEAPAPVPTPAAEPTTAPPAPAPVEEQKPETADYPTDSSIAGKKIIQPISDMNQKPDLNALLEKENEKQEVAQILGSAGVAPPPTPAPGPGQQTRPDDPNMIAL